MVQIYKRELFCKAVRAIGFGPSIPSKDVIMGEYKTKMQNPGYNKDKYGICGFSGSCDPVEETKVFNRQILLNNAKTYVKDYYGSDSNSKLAYTREDIKKYMPHTNLGGFSDGKIKLLADKFAGSYPDYCSEGPYDLISMDDKDVLILGQELGASHP